MVDSYALNVRNGFWGLDSTVYRPARWLSLKASEVRAWVHCSSLPLLPTRLPLQH